MYDIITFGSGTRDVYIICKDLQVVEEKKFITGKGIAVSLGQKIEVQNILFRTGGGATNSAAGFRLQGFRVTWCGMVGNDPGGREIIRDLKTRRVGTELVSVTKKKPTNYSVILCPTKQDRTILVYHGASSELLVRDIPWHKLKETQWFYLAPLSGKLANLFAPLVQFAQRNHILVAANPGNTQLKLPLIKLKPILKQLDILFLNQEEAAFLARTKLERLQGKEAEILKKLSSLCGGIVVMTKGPEGAVATDGTFVYRVPALKTKVVDRTGAGDAFCTGFLAEFMQTQDISSALQFGIANSAACISQWGAKEGLLKRGVPWKRVPVRKILLSRLR